MIRENLKKIRDMQGMIRKEILPVLEEIQKQEEKDLEKIDRKELENLEYYIEKDSSSRSLKEARNLLFKIDSLLCCVRGEDEKVSDVIRKYDVPEKNIECYTNAHPLDFDFSPLNKGTYIDLSQEEQKIVPAFNYMLMDKEEYQQFNLECGDSDECKYSFADAYGGDDAKVLVILLEGK